MDPSTDERVLDRPRFRTRDLLGVILVLGVLVGAAEAQRRRAIERTAALRELQSRGMKPDGRPTLECFVAMKLAAINHRPLEGVYSPLLDPRWYARANHYNAGRINDEEVPRVVRALSVFGRVSEVRFTSSTLEGVRLFYFDRVPSEDLARMKDVITIVDHSQVAAGGQESP